MFGTSYEDTENSSIQQAERSLEKEENTQKSLDLVLDLGDQTHRRQPAPAPATPAAATIPRPEEAPTHCGFELETK